MDSINVVLLCGQLQRRYSGRAVVNSTNNYCVLDITLRLYFYNDCLVRAVNRPEK